MYTVNLKMQMIAWIRRRNCFTSQAQIRKNSDRPQRRVWLRGPQLQNTPGTSQHAAFEVFWSKLAREIQIDKRTALRVSSLVKKGLLPCNALLLRDRARNFLELTLSESYPADSFRPRLILSEQTLHVLRHPSRPLAISIRRLVDLLPDMDATSLLRTTIGDLHLMDPELLILQLTEINAIFRTVFGSTVPQAVYSYLLMDQRGVRHKNEQKQQQQQQHGRREGQRAGDRVVQQQSSDLALSNMATAQSESVALVGMYGLQECAKSLCGALGHDLAFVCLRNNPELLDLPADEILSRIHALDNLLRFETGDQEKGMARGDTHLQRSGVRVGFSDLTCQVMEQGGELLLLPSNVLQEKSTELSNALSWSPPDIAQLLINEPRALRMDPREVAARAQRLEAIITLSTTVGVRPEWENEVDINRVGLLSLLLRHNGLNVLERLDFLLYSPASLRQGVSLARVLSETETDFQQRTPGFFRWRTTALHLRSYGLGIEIQNGTNNSSPQSVGLSRCCDQTTYTQEPLNIEVSTKIMGPETEKVSNYLSKSYGVQESQPSKGPRHNFSKKKQLTESADTGSAMANRGAVAAKVSMVHTSELLLGLQNSSDMIIQGP